MSHTVTAKVNFAFPKGDIGQSALGRAVAKAGGQVLGLGKHKLYQGSHEGFGFKLAGWNYPCVLDSQGTLHFDDYNGRWGDRAQLEKLKSIYGMEAARKQAEELGWQTQENGNDLQIFHPTGGMITITPEGVVDATGFTGMTCAEATKDIVAAMGGAEIEQRKAEYFVERANVQQTGG